MRATRKRLVAALMFVIVAHSATVPRANGTAASPVVVAVAIEILRNAANLGLELAGVQVMGGAWEYFKAVLEPVLRRFPDLLGFGQARTRAAREAAESLESDSSLQQAILDRLASLEEGQAQIAAKLRVYEGVLADHEARLQQIERAVRTGRREVAPLIQPGTNRYSDFRNAIQALIEQAGSPAFRGVTGAWLEQERAFESTIHIPGAESCRVQLSEGGRYVSCRMFHKSFVGWRRDLVSDSVEVAARRVSQSVYDEMVQLIGIVAPPFWERGQNHIAAAPPRSEKPPEGGLRITYPSAIDVFWAAEPRNGRRIEVRQSETKSLGIYRVDVQILPAGWAK